VVKLNFVPIEEMRHFYHEQLLPLLHKLMPYGDLGPRVEVRQTPDDVIVQAEIPGLKHPEHLDLRVQGTMVTIRGEVTRELPEAEGHDLLYTERVYGKFSRTVPLPVSVDPERVTASYQNGILTVTMKKNTELQGKPVPVEIPKIH
jgi:HSP20 family protein